MTAPTATRPYMRSRIAGVYREPHPTRPDLPDYRYVVNVTAGIGPVEGGSGLTTTHEPREEGALELTIQSNTMRGRRWESGGQSISEVERIVGHAPPDALDYSERIELVEIWRRWHLNGMRACCAHQDAERWTCTNIAGHYPPIVTGGIVTAEPFVVIAADQRYPGSPHTCPKCSRNRWDEPSDACPVSGYRAGTAWLHEPLPAGVVERVHAIMGRP